MRKLDTVEQRIADLVNLIGKCNYAYRTGDTSWFETNGLLPPSDKDYDKMLDDLAELDPTNPTLEEVGYEVADDSRKETLPVKMRSANKVKTLEEIHKWMSRFNIPPDSFVVCSPKMDGLSLLTEEAKQPGVELKKAWTRGSGTEGQLSALHFAALDAKNTLQYPFFTMGEAIISKKNYALYFKGKTNPRTKKTWGPARNVAAGAFNQDVPDARFNLIDFVRFGVQNFDGTSMDKTEQFKLANSLNTWQIPFNSYRLRDLTSEILDDLYQKWSVEYEIDGIIIDVDNADLREHLGIHTSGKYPNYMIAYKSDNEEIAETTVMDVILQISKQGNAIPVYLVEPTVLDGATVTRATGNNMKMLVDMKIAPGARIKLIRSGIVIPKVIEVVKPMDTSEIVNRPCPICGHQLEWSQPNDAGERIHRQCVNPNCDGTKYKRLLGFVETIGIDNVGPGIVDTIYNAGYTTVKQLLNMRLDDFNELNRFGISKSKKTYDALIKAMSSVTLSKLQHASQMFVGMGSTTLKVINDSINENSIAPGTPQMRIISREDAIALDGIGEKTADVYFAAIDAFWVWVNDLGITGIIDYQLQSMEKFDNNLEQTLTGKGVVFTKFRDEDMEAAIRDRGGDIKSGISKNSHILILKQHGSPVTGKEKKALDMGQEVYTPEEFTSAYLS